MGVIFEAGEEAHDVGGARYTYIMSIRDYFLGLAPFS
jgi:hypothetical protein